MTSNLPEVDNPPPTGTRFARFVFPAGGGPHRLPGLCFSVEKRRRPNGQAGISPVVIPGEKEKGRFLAQYFRAVFALSEDGRPFDGTHGATSGTLQLVCEGGGEVLVTDYRVAVVVIIGDSRLGSVNEDRGVIFALDLPYDQMGTVSLLRKTKFFGGVKQKGVQIFIPQPLAMIDLEPFARIVGQSPKPNRVEYETFANMVVRAACDRVLASTTLDHDARARIERVRNGHRVPDDLDLVAEVSVSD